MKQMLRVMGSAMLLGMLMIALRAVPARANPFAYVANRSDGTVSVIDTATNTVVGTIAEGDGPIAIAITPDGTRAYVTNGHCSRDPGFDMDMGSDHFYPTGSNRFSRGANDVWTG
jgi:YVTN family beta-propeller protein